MDEKKDEMKEKTEELRDKYQEKKSEFIERSGEMREKLQDKRSEMIERYQDTRRDLGSKIGNTRRYFMRKYVKKLRRRKKLK